MVDVLLEALLEHDISLIKDQRLEAIELNVASLDVIFDPTSGSNEKIDTIFELSGLIHNRNTTVDSDNSELLRVVLQLGELICDLNRKLASRCQHDRLNLAGAKKLVFAQVLDQGDAESHGLT